MHAMSELTLIGGIHGYASVNGKVCHLAGICRFSWVIPLNAFIEALSGG
jgi:uncharacterized membrane protein (UPF0136 family)